VSAVQAGKRKASTPIGCNGRWRCELAEDEIKHPLRAIVFKQKPHGRPV
jgi:hypothetical protein